MNAYIWRVFFLSLLVTLAACSSAANGGSVPSALDSAPQVTGGHEIFRKLSVQPDAGSPATLMNFVSNGPAQGGVPCIGCVSGASSNDTIGLTGPSSYVRTSATWQYALSFTDLSYKGKCTLAWAITAGKKTIDRFSASFKLASDGGFVLYAVDRARPKYSGPATLTGKYTCGKNSQSAQAPLYFQ
ncbi:MAG: hypothetical protein WAK84_01945 [Candidatus Cybelea sp.]